MYVCMFVCNSYNTSRQALLDFYCNRVLGLGYCKSDTAQIEVLLTDLFMLSGCIWFLNSLRNTI